VIKAYFIETIISIVIRTNFSAMASRLLWSSSTFSIRAAFFRLDAIARDAELSEQSEADLQRLGQRLYDKLIEMGKEAKLPPENIAQVCSLVHKVDNLLLSFGHVMK